LWRHLLEHGELAALSVSRAFVALGGAREEPPFVVVLDRPRAGAALCDAGSKGPIFGRVLMHRRGRALPIQREVALGVIWREGKVRSRCEAGACAVLCLWLRAGSHRCTGVLAYHSLEHSV
jgi:hypothetical protein